MKKFENKKILLMGKETYSYPLYFLGQRWAKNNKVGIYFFNPPECMYNRCFLNDTTFWKFKENKDFIVYTSTNITKEFIGGKENQRINVDSLRKLEKQYNHFRNFNLQTMSSQFLTRPYHYRNYMGKCTYEQQMNWLILNYQNAIKIVNEFMPDVIIDCDNAELARTVMLEIAYQKKIPYIMILQAGCSWTG